MRTAVVLLLLLGVVVMAETTLGQTFMQKLLGLSESKREDDLRAVSDFYRRTNGPNTPVTHPQSLSRLRAMDALAPDNTIREDVRDSVILRTRQLQSSDKDEL
jgi:hypothetical protein